MRHRLKLVASILVVITLLCGALFSQSNSDNIQCDKIIILKSERTLQLLKDGKVIRTYKVALGGSPTGAKTRQGDQKTPEGNYTIDARNPYSRYHKSLHISYPD